MKAEMPESQRKFAWGSDRIASSLLNKMDTFTARNEDHTRKLLWTLGANPVFKDDTHRNQIRVTPQNFGKICDRFGIRCDEQQAAEIFQTHGLPMEGCTLHQLTSKFVASKVDLATIVRDQARHMHGDAARPPAALRQRTPIKPPVPHHYAHLASAAWRAQPATAHASAASTAAAADATTDAAPPVSAAASQPPPAAVASASGGKASGSYAPPPARAATQQAYAGMYGGTRAAAQGAQRSLGS